MLLNVKIVSAFPAGAHNSEPNLLTRLELVQTRAIKMSNICKVTACKEI
jgi:hypothetical protein